MRAGAQRQSLIALCAGAELGPGRHVHGHRLHTARGRSGLKGVYSPTSELATVNREQPCVLDHARWAPSVGSAAILELNCRCRASREPLRGARAELNSQWRFGFCEVRSDASPVRAGRLRGVVLSRRSAMPQGRVRGCRALRLPSCPGALRPATVSDSSDGGKERSDQGVRPAARLRADRAGSAATHVGGLPPTRELATDNREQPCVLDHARWAPRSGVPPS